MRFENITVNCNSGKVYKFTFFETLEPDVDSKGSIETYDYKDYEVGGKRNKDGKGPFCHFSLKHEKRGSCVYFWLRENSDPKYLKNRLYIGKTDDLQQRFYNYGHITASDCEEDGNSTDCKMNKVLLQLKRVDLYVCPTDNPKKVESEILATITTVYNEKEN